MRFHGDRRRRPPAMTRQVTLVRPATRRRHKCPDPYGHRFDRDPIEVPTGGSARVLSESTCHSARCHTAGETYYQNVEPVLGNQHGAQQTKSRPVGRGSQVGSHRRSTWSHIEPATPFDSDRLPGIQRHPATSADTRDLVRIEGVRGSNPLSSTEFFQVRDLFRAPRPQLSRSVSDFGSDLGADLVRGAALLCQQGVEDRHD
jgi:hypothetical protein